MQWQRILLALTVMFGASAVALPAHANPNFIWVKSTSGNDSTAEAKLRADLVKIGVATDVTINTDRLANAVYDKAVEAKCFNGISELGNTDFLKAFMVEWKTAFRKKYRLTATSVSWDAFKQVGRQFGGFEICSQADNKLLVQNVQAQTNVARLSQEVQQIAEQPMSPEDAVKRDGIIAAIEDLKSEMAGNTAAVGRHEAAIAALNKQLAELTGRVVEAEKVVARVDSLEQRFGVVETATTENTSALNELSSLPGEVAAVKAVSAANSAAINGVEAGDLGLVVRLNKVEESTGQLNLTALGGIGLGLIALLLVVVALRQFNKKEQPEKLARGQGQGFGSKPAAGKPAPSADAVFELNTPIGDGKGTNS